MTLTAKYDAMDDTCNVIVWRVYWIEMGMKFCFCEMQINQNRMESTFVTHVNKETC